MLPLPASSCSSDHAARNCSRQFPPAQRGGSTRPQHPGPAQTPTPTSELHRSSHRTSNSLASLPGKHLCLLQADTLYDKHLRSHSCQLRNFPHNQAKYSSDGGGDRGSHFSKTQAPQSLNETQCPRQTPAALTQQRLSGRNGDKNDRSILTRERLVAPPSRSGQQWPGDSHGFRHNRPGKSV